MSYACICCRPSGSSDVYYVDSGTDMLSTAVSETTVESTHLGMYALIARLILSLTISLRLKKLIYV